MYYNEGNLYFTTDENYYRLDISRIYNKKHSKLTFYMCDDFINKAIKNPQRYFCEFRNNQKYHTFEFEITLDDLRKGDCYNRIYDAALFNSKPDSMVGKFYSSYNPNICYEDVEIKEFNNYSNDEKDFASLGVDTYEFYGLINGDRDLYPTIYVTSESFDGKILEFEKECYKNYKICKKHQRQCGTLYYIFLNVYEWDKPKEKYFDVLYKISSFSCEIPTLNYLPNGPELTTKTY